MMKRREFIKTCLLTTVAASILGQGRGRKARDRSRQAITAESPGPSRFESLIVKTHYPSGPGPPTYHFVMATSFSPTQ